MSFVTKLPDLPPHVNLSETSMKKMQAEDSDSVKYFWSTSNAINYRQFVKTSMWSNLALKACFWVCNTIDDEDIRVDTLQKEHLCTSNLIFLIWAEKCMFIYFNYLIKPIIILFYTHFTYTHSWQQVLCMLPVIMCMLNNFYGESWRQ